MSMGSACRWEVHVDQIAETIKFSLFLVFFSLFDYLKYDSSAKINLVSASTKKEAITRNLSYVNQIAETVEIKVRRKRLAIISLHSDCASRQEIHQLRRILAVTW